MAPFWLDGAVQTVDGHWDATLSLQLGAALLATVAVVVGVNLLLQIKKLCVQQPASQM